MLETEWSTGAYSRDGATPLPGPSYAGAVALDRGTRRAVAWAPCLDVRCTTFKVADALEETQAAARCVFGERCAE